MKVCGRHQSNHTETKQSSVTSVNAKKALCFDFFSLSEKEKKGRHYFWHRLLSRAHQLFFRRRQICLLSAKKEPPTGWERRRESEVALKRFYLSQDEELFFFLGRDCDDVDAAVRRLQDKGDERQTRRIQRPARRHRLHGSSRSVGLLQGLHSGLRASRAANDHHLHTFRAAP